MTDFLTALLSFFKHLRHFVTQDVASVSQAGRGDWIRWAFLPVAHRSPTLECHLSSFRALARAVNTDFGHGGGGRYGHGHLRHRGHKPRALREAGWWGDLGLVLGKFPRSCSSVVKSADLGVGRPGHWGRAGTPQRAATGYHWGTWSSQHSSWHVVISKRWYLGF